MYCQYKYDNSEKKFFSECIPKQIIIYTLGPFLFTTNFIDFPFLFIISMILAYLVHVKLEPILLKFRFYLRISLILGINKKGPSVYIYIYITYKVMID